MTIFVVKLKLIIIYTMEIIADLLKITVPAAIVLYGVFLTVRSFLNKDYEKKLVELRMKSNEQITPIRLQAYERMCLLLERITPANHIARLPQSELTAFQLQFMLVSEIRAELNHNLSQQLYMSHKVWTMVKNAVEDTVSLVNIAASGLNENSRGIELSRKIIELYVSKQELPIEIALQNLKTEIQEIF